MPTMLRADGAWVTVRSATPPVDVTVSPAGVPSGAGVGMPTLSGSGLTAWPNATNTGYLGDIGDLTTVGGMGVGTNGATFDHYRFTDTVGVGADNVTFRNCIFEAGYFGIDHTSGTNLLIEDCTVIGGLNCGLALNGGVTVRRCNIYGGYDGMKIGGDNAIIQDNYIHDLFTDAESHNDGIQCGAGDNWQFLHNWIDSPDTSCIAMFFTQGVWDDILIQNNYLTGPGYPLYLGGTDATNVRVLDNTFDVWGFGPATDWAPGQVGNVWSGNIRAGTGAPVNP